MNPSLEPRFASFVSFVRVKAHLPLLVPLLLGAAIAACSSDGSGGAPGAGAGGADASVAPGGGDAAGGSGEAGLGAEGSTGGEGGPGVDAGTTTDAGAAVDAAAYLDGASAIDGSVVANPAQLDEPTKAKLRAGGSADATFAWAYPYDGTVFPLAIDAPVLQFKGAAVDAVYVKAVSGGSTYEGFFGPASAPLQVPFDAATWAQLQASLGADRTLHVEVSILQGGAVTGPRAATWSFASAPLPGSIYYDLLLTDDAGGGRAAIYKWKQGAATTAITDSQGCLGCHSISANGKVLFASQNDGAGGNLIDTDTLATRYAVPGDDPSYIWGALTPDGALMLTNGAPGQYRDPNVSGQEVDAPPNNLASTLLDVSTRQKVDAPGLTVQFALMPSFSQDGTRLAFNHYDTGAGHSLAVMGFTPSSRAFTAPVDIASDPNHLLGWPTFTPDGTHVVFATGNQGDYATNDPGTQGDLEVTSSSGPAVAPLDALNGKGYLPFGDAAEGHLNFWPSVAPDPAGGYVWVAFTSRRMVGVTTQGAAPSDLAREKIWVAALDPTITPGKDPSHPAFLLPAQDPAPGTMRPTWVH